MTTAKKTYVWKDPGLVTNVMTAIMGLTFLDRVGQTAFAFGGPAVSYDSDMDHFTPLQATHALFDVGSIFLFFGIGSAIFWALRVSINAHTFSRHMGHRPAATIWWYLAPFANFVMPYNVMREIWSVSGGGSANLLKLWWGLFILSNLVSALLRLPDMPPAITGLAYGIGCLSIAAFLTMAQQLKALQRITQSTDVFSDGPEQDAVLNFT
jgi:hypothetical protein